MDDQNSTVPCLSFLASCDPQVEVELCCEGFCQSVPVQGPGYCNRVNCLDNGARCKGDASLGNCCSGYCDHYIGEPDGVCMDRNSTGTRVPPIWKEPEEPVADVQLLIYGVIGALVVLVAVCGITLCLWTRARRGKRTDGVKTFMHGGSGAYQEPGNILPLSTYIDLRRMIDSKPYKTHYEIPETDLQIDDTRPPLGSGEFSIVFHAVVRDTQVAAKTVGPRVSDSEYLRALLRELKVLMDVGAHENMVRLIGACTTRLRHGLAYVFTELCVNGSLEFYIREHRDAFLPNGPASLILSDPGANLGYVPLTPPTGREPGQLTLAHLRRWCIDVATGMAHLSGLGVVHGDLATRNVLLNGELLAKISDFGLSRKLYAYTTYVKQNKEIPMPWQHMAPEALERFSFSIKSDVWSFGITVWELFRLGDVPYLGMKYGVEFLEGLTSIGFRLPKPDYASEGEYAIMRRCWALEPEERPSFIELKALLNN